ncbi:MAG: hypothetical protein ACI9EW_003427 [Cellvibrionaceae bacterium]|jgi:hypothetical protein
MSSFLTLEALSVLIGVIVILVSLTYSKLEEANVSTSERFLISAKTSLLVLAILLLVWGMLYRVIVFLTDQRPDSLYEFVSGIPGVVLIFLSFIISREAINRIVKKWSD